MRQWPAACLFAWFDPGACTSLDTFYHVLGLTVKGQYREGFGSLGVAQWWYVLCTYEGPVPSTYTSHSCSEDWTGAVSLCVPKCQRSFSWDSQEEWWQHEFREENRWWLKHWLSVVWVALGEKILCSLVLASDCHLQFSNALLVEVNNVMQFFILIWAKE